MEGYRALPELLHRAELDVVFSMLGGTNVAWIAQGVQAGTLRLIKTRHEETAVGAATGFSRSTGAVGLASVTRGPGFTNSMTALMTAVQGHVPLLLIVGESPTTTVQSSQNVDQRGLSAVIGAGFHHVAQAEELESTFWDAVLAAHRHACPQVLSLANGVLEGSVVLSDARPVIRPDAPPSLEAVAACVDALEASERPLLLAGGGAVLADCRAEMVELAELTGARLATTLRAHRFFAGHPADLGLCGGWSPTSVRQLLRATDVVFAVGASLNDYTTDKGRVFPDAAIVQCDTDPTAPSAATRPALALIGDGRGAVRAVIDEWRRRGLPTRPAPSPAPTAAEIRAAALEVDLGHDPARGLDPRDVYVALEDALPADRVVVTDNGRWIGTLPSLVGARDARSWLIGNSYGSVGQGLGNAIGAAAAHPGRTVVLFCGDGGFMMAAQALDAVRINGLDMMVVVLNDEQYGSEAKYVDRYGLPRDVIEQGLPDIPTLALALGGRGLVVRSRADLDELPMRPAGLTILDVRVDPEVNVRAVLDAWSRAGAIGQGEYAGSTVD